MASDGAFMTHDGLLGGLDASCGANRGVSASTMVWVDSGVAFMGGLGSLATRRVRLWSTLYSVSLL